MRAWLTHEKVVITLFMGQLVGGFPEPILKKLRLPRPDDHGARNNCDKSKVYEGPCTAKAWL